GGSRREGRLWVLADYLALNDAAAQRGEAESGEDQAVELHAHVLVLRFVGCRSRHCNSHARLPDCGAAGRAAARPLPKAYFQTLKHAMRPKVSTTAGRRFSFSGGSRGRWGNATPPRTREQSRAGRARPAG